MNCADQCKFTRLTPPKMYGIVTSSTSSMDEAAFKDWPGLAVPNLHLLSLWCSAGNYGAGKPCLNQRTAAMAEA